MTELGTALRELADRQQPVGGLEPSDLWVRGRQRVARRRVVAGTLLAALALVVGGLGVTGPEPRLVSPAGRPHELGIPDRIEDPPTWLPAADYGTKIGPFSVLARAMRHGRMELFGIDAASGRYRFLPNGEVQVPDTPVALSPNGRYVAYWAGSNGSTVTSLTIFDTVIGTESGLSLGEGRYGYLAGPLTWLDDKTVLLAFDEKSGAEDQTFSATHKVETFGPGGRGPEIVPVPLQTVAWSRARDGSLLVPYAASAGMLKNPPEVWQSLGSSNTKQNGPFLSLPQGEYRQVSRSGDLSVVIGSSAAGGHVALLAGRTDDARPGSLHDVGDLYVGTFLGWRSADSVLVTGWRHSPSGQASLYEANVRTGQVKRIGDAGDDVDVVLAMASGLLEKPLIEARPPSGFDPRLVRIGVVAGLFLAAAGLLLWRRRARS